MPPTPMALVRYQAISAYLAEAPPRGQRRVLLERLAARPWTLPDGEQTFFAAETLRSWVRRYRRGGLEALNDKPRARPGVKALNEEQIELLCGLKREVPERSLDRLLKIVEEMGLVERGVVRRSTLHRVLQKHGLSSRPKTTSSVTDLDRFEAPFPNALWQSDMLAGPMLPDPRRPGRQRRAWLYAFIDDHSRLMLAGRFSFKGDLPALELVFREALRRHGVPTKVYYDNGKTFRSKHMKQVVAELGIHSIIHTKPYRPQGHGKIEAFNRLIRSGFIAELKASPVETLDQLNLAFQAWAERDYNRENHGETGETPRDRWRQGLDRIQRVDNEVLRRAFLWSEKRKADKTGVFSLFGCRYQVGADLAGKQVELRYDAEGLDQVEVWFDGRFRERVRPFEVQKNRRPTVETPPSAEGPKAHAPWLGHLVEQHLRERRVDPEANETGDALLRQREALDEGVVTVLRDRLDPAVFDEPTVRTWLARFGPVEPDFIAGLIDDAAPHMGLSQHIDQYLDLAQAYMTGADT